jgi:hypothetical protein
MGNVKDVARWRKCAHEQCRCEVPDTQEYCGDYCSDADDVSEIVLQCACEHAACPRTKSM